MIGKTVGHYRITASIGAGGMGEVYLAEDTRLDRKAAVKFLPADVARDPDRRHRFLTEAKAASALNHPNVCVVYDVGETEDGLPFIAMEFVDGRSLSALAKERPLEIPRVVAIAIEVADALDAAHARGIVHRDIKPDNISVNDRGQVKVLDFGLAKRVLECSSGSLGTTLEGHQTQEGQLLGTPSYMSPEQAVGRTVDHRSDLFSLGTVMYCLLTGRSPFAGASMGEVLDNVVHRQPDAIARFNYDVPPELERITLKLLAKQVDRRYQSARDLLVDLKNLARVLDQPNAEECSAWSGGSSQHHRTTQAMGPIAAPPSQEASLEAVKSSEVLLNYAAIDDLSLIDGRPGWVSQLHRNLEVRVEQLSGEKVAIARVPDLSGSKRSGSSVVPAEVIEHLPQVKAMISVVSPPFIRSPVCRSEVEEFWRVAEQTGGQWVEDRSRLLKVLKTAVSAEDLPRPLADIFSPLLGFEFFEIDPQTGRIREFDETFGPVLKQRFFERVYDLAHDLCQILKTLRQLHAGPSAISTHSVKRQWVYLATTTSDVADERDRVRRELIERGHIVLPDTPLPMLSRDVETVVQTCLAKCSIAVHLLGRRYGVTPEDSSESIPALQLRLTSMDAKRRALQRLIWIPGDEPLDERQRDFVKRVQEDPALHHHAEIIEGNLNLLKTDLIRRLNPPEEKSPVMSGQAALKPAGKGAPKLYLICDARDESAIEELEDYLFTQGIEVCLPAFDGSDADAEVLHQENLRSCDAVLVYYGSAPKAWVDIKLRELLKAAGYGRDSAIPFQAVYVAPPTDHRKERFRSHQAAVIRGPEQFLPGPDLDAFVGSIKEARA
jgi:serine/threonine protein kinase